MSLANHVATRDRVLSKALPGKQFCYALVAGKRWICWCDSRFNDITDGKSELTTRSMPRCGEWLCRLTPPRERLRCPMRLAAATRACQGRVRGPGNLDENPTS